MELSVVIITKNEAHVIGKALESVQGLADEIIIVDSQSADATLDICAQHKTVIIQTIWKGYGANKNMGIEVAKNDWILSLDADEMIDDKFKNNIQKLSLENEKEVYKIKRKNYFCGKLIRYGGWGNDTTIRIFNRKNARWNNDAVHERLTLSGDSKVVLLNGSLLHFTVDSMYDYMTKTIKYAKLSAQKYFENKKKTKYLKLYMSPAFIFLKEYVFRLGFLDGKEGLLIAKTTARYTFLKYAYLKEMNKTSTT